MHAAPLPSPTLPSSRHRPKDYLLSLGRHNMFPYKSITSLSLLRTFSPQTLLAGSLYHTSFHSKFLEDPFLATYSVRTPHIQVTHITSSHIHRSHHPLKLCWFVYRLSDPLLTHQLDDYQKTGYLIHHRILSVQEDLVVDTC